MTESSEEKILGMDVRKFRAKENIADVALAVGIVLFFSGIILIPQMLVPGAIIIASGVIAVAIKNKQ